MSFFLEKNLGLRMNLNQAMQMASDQAELGLEQTTPNPCVGCVILNEKDELVGLGYHKKFGDAHAEVEAFNSIEKKSSSERLTVFVTLEPCAHEGKTPSCAKMLVEQNVSRVIYLLEDPNPLVLGQGKKILEDAGIKTYCIEDLLRRQKLDQDDEILKSIYKFKKNLNRLIQKQKYLNRQFLYAINSERPYITLKWAQTLDGTIGLNHERLMITNPEVQKEVHHLRACHDVLLIGSVTVLKDNPKLNNRFGSSKTKKNLLAIIDFKLDLFSKFEDLEIFEIHQKENLIFITHNSTNTDDFEKMGFQFIKVDYEDVKTPIPNLEIPNTDEKLIPAVENLNEFKKLDIEKALILIKKKYKINSVFVEGGSKLLTSFLISNNYNEIYAFFGLTFNFKKHNVRINYSLWLKAFIKNVFNFRFRFYESNFKINFLNERNNK